MFEKNRTIQMFEIVCHWFYYIAVYYSDNIPDNICIQWYIGKSD